MATWPSGLPPTLLIEGSGFRPGEGVREFQPDIGPAQSRLDTMAVEDPFSGDQFLSGAQMGLLESFIRDEIAGRALPFDWVHPVTGAPASVKLKSQPQAVQLGPDLWRVTYQLAVQPTA